ncbi:hypothetical protein BH10PSE9_BH10PSE9_21250 [soil metagenome]
MNWPGNRQRWLGFGLVASLALNAFFIGAAATDAFRLKKPTDREDARLRFELRWLSGRLSPESMASVQAALTAGRPAVEQHIARLRDLRTGLREMTAAAQPDRAAVDARLGEIRAELDKMAVESQKTTMDALLALPPSARTGLAGN